MKKKMLCSALVLAMLSLNTTGVLADEPMKGDTDASGVLTASDCAVLLRKVLDESYTMPIEEKTSDYMKYADITGDGILAADDATAILEKVLFGTWGDIGSDNGTENTTENTTEATTEATTAATTEATTETTTQTATETTEFTTTATTVVTDKTESTTESTTQANVETTEATTEAGTEITTEAGTETTTQTQTETSSEETTEATTEGTTEAVTYQSVIVLKDGASTVNGLLESNGGVELDNTSNIITITDGGSYDISGELTNGQLVVNSATDVELNLNGVTITNANGPAIYGLDGDIDISAKKGSVNTLTDGTPTSVDEDGEPDACIFSHDDIKLKGTGTLIINGNYADGVSTKDKLTVQKLTLNVNSNGNCLKGKDSVTITSGTLTLVSSTGDGVRCTKGDITVNGGSITITAPDNGLFAKTGNVIVNDGEININTDTSKADTSTYNYDGIHSKAGSVSLNGGSLTITAYGDGVQAATDLTVGSAKVNVTTTGTTTTTSTNGRPMWQESSSSDVSSKGLKSDSVITIAEGADITVTSTDDSIHSDDTILIDGGTMVLSTDDDGIHADTKLTVNGGSIEITKSYEGLEAASIYINDGNISIKASDDSINAAGGNDSSGYFGNSSSTGYMEFNGGYVYCENTNDGDGIDSNGSIVINGGTLLINGTSQDDNAAIDYGDNNGDYLAYNGGSVFAVGSSGMAVKPDTSKSAGYTLYYGGSSSNKGGFNGGFGGGFGGNSSSSSITSGTLLTLTDADGNVVVAFKTKNAATAVTISSDDIKSGTTYTLYKGGTYSGTLDDNDYATGGTVTGATKLASATVNGKVTTMS